MPPFIDSPSEVGAILVAVLGGLATVGVAIVGAAAAVYTAWRSKLRPLLLETKDAAEHAATQLTPNHGSSAKDSLERLEISLDRMERTLSQRIVDLRADVRTDRDATNRRLSHLEAIASANRKD